MASNTFLITIEADQYNKTVAGSVFNEHRFKFYGTDIAIDWGDGTQETDVNNTGEYGTSHVYDSAGIYTINITGNIIGLADRFLAASVVKVRSIVFPDTLQTIGNGCCIFDDDFTQTKIVIPEGVTTIGGSFLRGTNVEEIVLPSTLTSIGTEFCQDCTSLKQVTMKSRVMPTASGVAFTNCSNYKIFVPSRLLNEYISNNKYPSSEEYYDIYEESIAGKVYLLGKKLAENLSNQNILANANEGLTTLANKILDINGPEYKELTYKIQWTDNDNLYQERPSQAPVVLLANNEIIDGTILTFNDATDTYYYRANVPIYDINGKEEELEIDYTWKSFVDNSVYTKQETTNQNIHTTTMQIKNKRRLKIWPRYLTGESAIDAIIDIYGQVTNNDDDSEQTIQFSDFKIEDNRYVIDFFTTSMVQYSLTFKTIDGYDPNPARIRGASLMITAEYDEQNLDIIVAREFTPPGDIIDYDTPL